MNTRQTLTRIYLFVIHRTYIPCTKYAVLCVLLTLPPMRNTERVSVSSEAVFFTITTDDDYPQYLK